MQQTENLNLPLYELDDMANLSDGYNNAMNKIDSAYAENEARFPIKSEDIEDGGINTVDIANGAITENKIATAAVTDTKIAANAVTETALSDGAVTLAKINSDAFDETPTANSANLVTSGGVESYVQTELDNIPIPTINTENIANEAVTLAKINSDAFDEAPTANSANLVTSGGVEAFVKESIPSSIMPKNMVVIGDSFIAGTAGHGVTFRNKLAELFECDNVYNFAVSGMGFVSGGTPFITQLQNAAASTDFENENVDLIFVVGNVNDVGITDTTSVTNAISTFNNTAKSTFPNATIHYCIGDCRNVNTYKHTRLERQYISHIASIGGLVHDMLGVVPPAYYEANGEHWSDYGCIIAANYIFSGALLPQTPFSNLAVNNFSQILTGNNTANGVVGKYGGAGKITFQLNADIAANSVITTFENQYLFMLVNSYVSSYNIDGFAQDGTIFRFNLAPNSSGKLELKSYSAIPASKTYLYVDISQMI